MLSIRQLKTLRKERGIRSILPSDKSYSEMILELQQATTRELAAQGRVKIEESKTTNKFL